MCAETKTLSLDISLNAFPGSLIPLSSFKIILLGRFREGGPLTILDTLINISTISLILMTKVYPEDERIAQNTEANQNQDTEMNSH